MPPAGSVAKVSVEEALWAALRPGERVREVVLAELDDTYAVPPVHALAWVVSVIPIGGRFLEPGGPAGVPTWVPRLRPITHDLMFVDAITGNVIYGVMGN
ncbi:MAG: hypothetical protein ACYC9X_14205 [Dehalococcoidia bacterium]